MYNPHHQPDAGSQPLVGRIQRVSVSMVLVVVLVVVIVVVRTPAGERGQPGDAYTRRAAAANAHDTTEGYRRLPRVHIYRMAGALRIHHLPHMAGDHPTFLIWS